MKGILKKSLLILLFSLAGFPMLSAQILIDKEDDINCTSGGRAEVISVQNGTPPFRYSWSNGAATRAIENLSPSIYTVTVIDANDCIGEESVKIEGVGGYQIDRSTTVEREPCSGQPSIVTIEAWLEGEEGVVASQTRTVIPPATLRFTFSGPDGCTYSTPEIKLGESIAICSKDPNDMVGPPGFGEKKWVSVNEELNYQIRFENDQVFATAPAQRIEIDHVFDGSIDPFSLRLGRFSFHQLAFEVPANSTHYSERLDLRDSIGLMVDVIAGLNVVEHKAFWIFQAIDPLTGLPPTDPHTGFLPVNDSLTRVGEGYVDFTVRPKSNAQTGDSIIAVANIVFDRNEVIPTPEIFNLIDAFPPSSSVNPLPASSEETSFAISWTGVDDPGGCGIRDYDLFVSRDGAPFELYQSGIQDTFLIFDGILGATYEFYTRATDRVGNREPDKLVGETVINLTDAPYILVHLPGSHSFCANDQMAITWSAFKVTSVHIELSTDGGTSYMMLAQAVDTSGGPFMWTIPGNVSGASSIIRISDATDPDVRAFSEAFSLFPTPQVDAGQDISLCTGSSAQLSASGGVLFNWSGDAGLDDPEMADPIVSPLASTSYFVTVTDHHGCSASDSVRVTVLDLPMVESTFAGPAFCLNDEPEELATIPPGGVFSGPGVIDNHFDPALAGVGEHRISFSFTGDNGCIIEEEQTVRIDSLPEVFFYGLAPAYCEDSSPVALTGNPEGGMFSGAGITGDSFYPAAAGGGQHLIEYVFVNAGGCAGTAMRTVEVTDAVAVSFSGLSDQYCEKDSAVLLVGNPAGGLFSGPGISGNLFEPSAAGPGTHALVYTYDEGEGCANTFALTTLIQPAPEVFIAGLNSHYAPIDTFVLLTGIPSGGLFSGPGVTASQFNPGDAGIGTHIISYAFSDNQGCSNTAEFLVEVEEDSINSLINPHSRSEIPEAMIAAASSPAKDTTFKERDPGHPEEQEEPARQVEFKFYAFPNPTKGETVIEVQLEKAAEIHIDIFNSLGGIVRRFTYSGNVAYRQELDLTSNPAGVYWIQIRIGDHQFTEKLILLE